MIRILNFGGGDLVLTIEGGSPYTALGLGGKVTRLEGKTIQELVPLLDGCYTIMVTSAVIQNEVLQVLRNFGCWNIHYDLLHDFLQRSFIKPGKFSDRHFYPQVQSVIRFDSSSPCPILWELGKRGYKFIVRYGPEYILI